MATATFSTVIAAFESRDRAQEAIDDLVQAGFRADQIGLIARDAGGQPILEEDRGAHTADGTLAGMVAGAGVGGLWAVGIAAGVLPVIGPIIAGGILASIVASAAGGAAVGGLVGALIGIGVPKGEAEFYESEFKAGRTIITVKANGRADEAQSILQRHEGLYVHRESQSPLATAGNGPTEATELGYQVDRTEPQGMSQEAARAADELPPRLPR